MAIALFKREKISAGIDIGTHTVKAIEITQRANKISLSGLGVERILSGGRPGIIDAIKRAIVKSNITSKSVGVSISGPCVAVRYVVLPAMTLEELKSSLNFEAEKHMPFKIDEMHLDCNILATGLEGNKMRVLLVGARKDAIESITSILDELGLTAAFVDVDGFCVANGLEFSASSEGRGKICALLNVGYQFTNIAIINDFSPCFSRDVTIGGSDMAAAIKSKVGVSLDDAEALLRNPGELFEQVQTHIKPVYDRLIGEIRVSFDYYESHYEKGIDAVFLSGGCARLVGFGKFLEDTLGLDVVSWKPLANLAVPAELKEQASAAETEMAVALGLAARGLR